MSAEEMPVLRIGVEGVSAAESAAVPTLRFALRLDTAGGQEIRAVSLDTQIRIAATERAYDERSKQRLAELFGPPDGWHRTVSSLLWTQTVTQVPPFTGTTAAHVDVACTYDFEVAVVKYFHGLSDGEVPLRFLFGGTVFYLAGGLLRAVRIGWDTEAEFRMPVRVWKNLMDHYFPGTAWLRIGRDVFDRLCDYKVRHTLHGWDDVVGALLKTGDS